MSAGVWVVLDPRVVDGGVLVVGIDDANGCELFRTGRRTTLVDALYDARGQLESCEVVIDVLELRIAGGADSLIVNVGSHTASTPNGIAQLGAACDVL